MTLVFAGDSITIQRGISDTAENINSEYMGYTTRIFANDNLYRVSFSKRNKIIVYEFKLLKSGCSPKPVLSYSLKINNVVKHVLSTSCNMIFIHG